MLTTYEGFGAVTIRLSEEQLQKLKELLSDGRVMSLQHDREYKEPFSLTMFRLQLEAELNNYV